MKKQNENMLNRREFIKRSAYSATVAALCANSGYTFGFGKKSNANQKKVIVLGIDGMDPVLTEKMMAAGKLPNFARLAERNGYRRLGTSMPPQSPVAWSNFITGAGPGVHGIFDFIHRDPTRQCAPYYSVAETKSGRGSWGIGEYNLQVPFLHKPAKTILRRQGVPFWDYIDKAGIYSTFYNLPSNYPASESKYGYHRCLSGMGTPDLLGTYGTYQHFSEDGPLNTTDEPRGGGQRSLLFFENEAADGNIYGPGNDFLKEPSPVKIPFKVYRDIDADSALIEIQANKILLKKGQWSKWVQLDFKMLPWYLGATKLRGICRFYLQEVSPNFRLYVTPVNNDPSDPATKLTEPEGFIEDISSKLGLFYNTGFQEDHKALSNKVFTDEEFAVQSGIVLDERLNLLNYANDNYDDGLLFFYFSSTDLQAHMFWWNSEKDHPVRSTKKAREFYGHLQRIYQKMDSVLGDILKRYGDKATVMVLSDHGFTNFERQFDLNGWLRRNGYLYPADSTSIFENTDWSGTVAYGLGINGLYLNMKSRERDGIVASGQENEKLLNELVTKLEAVRDNDGSKVINKVYRADKLYNGPATAMAPDLIVGYDRRYRASWGTCLGGINDEIISDNDSAWAADHCADAAKVPGIFFCNKPIAAQATSLSDLAPTILNEFGLNTPASMIGSTIL